MTATTRLDLAVLLPDAPDLEDACVERLVELLSARSGVERVHIVRSADPGQAGRLAELCLHYDPERLSVGRVTALAELAGAQVDSAFGHVVAPIRVIASEDDARRIEADLRLIDGITSAVVSLPAQVARVEFSRTTIDAPTVEKHLAELGILASVPAAPARPTAEHRDDDQEHDHDDHGSAEGASWYRRNRELAWSLAAGGWLAAGWVTSLLGGPRPASIACYAIAYAFGARDNVGHFLGDLRHGRFRFNIDLLMVVAAIGAAILGEWRDGALLLFLFSLGHALEHYAMARARRAISSLAELMPQTVDVMRDGAERSIAAADVRPGDQVIVKPGQRIGVDGVITDGRSSVNQAPVTGESVPVPKSPGDQVFAGTVNGEGALVIRVTVAVGDRTLDRVIRMVAEAQTQKAPTQQFTDRFERIFVPFVLVADAALILIPPLLGAWTWADAFYRGMTLLVAASPCALALGTPAAVLAGIAQAARRGVLIKGGVFLEALGGIDVLALDKTGTITQGRPVVSHVVPQAGVSEDELIGAAAAVEKRSQHPLAAAITSAAADRKLVVIAAGNTESVAGEGVRGQVAGHTVEVGRIGMLEKDSTVAEDVYDAVYDLERAGRTAVAVRRGGRILGVIGIGDTPREGVRQVLDQLRQLGVQDIIMLTGDTQAVGDAIGQAVGIQDIRGGLMPEDKAAVVRELALTRRIIMVGDGVNDAPALAYATVGIAMGGAGTAAALETADVALMGDDLGRLPFAIGLSRAARAVIRQNVAIALGVIALLAAGSVLSLIGIGVAVAVHEGSTLVVIANALRLLRYEQPAAQQP